MTDEELKEELLGEITQYLTRPSIVNIIVAGVNNPTMFSVRCLNNT